MRLLVILVIVTIVMAAMSIAFFSITVVLQALDGILLTLQAVLWTIERGDIFLKAVLCALILLVVITSVTKQYGSFLRRLFHLPSHRYWR